MEIREKIERLLKERNWTRYRLSQESGLSESTVTNMFYRNNMPSLSTVSALASAFGMTLSQFFYEGDDIIELTEEQKDLLASWSLLTKKQRQIIIDLTKSFSDP